MFKKLCIWILIIGGIQISLRGLFSFDVISWICGGALTVAGRIVYALFGLAAIGYIAAALHEESKQKPADQ